MSTTSVNQQPHRLSYASITNSSLNIDAYYSANEDDSDRPSSFQFDPQTAHLQRKGTWNSIGASTIRLSTARQQSIISNASSYYSTNNAGDRESQLGSPVSFPDSNRVRTLTKSDADNMLSELDFTAYGSPGPSMDSPKSFHSRSTVHHSSQSTPSSAAAANSSPRTLGSETDNASFQIVSPQYLETHPEPGRVTSESVRDLNTLSYHSKPEDRESSLLEFNSDISTPNANNSARTSKANPLSYGNEVFDNSYESTTKTPNPQASPLLPPNVKGPTLLPRESFTPIFDNNNRNLPSGTSGAFRVSSTSDIFTQQANVPNLNSNAQQEAGYQPFVVHPARPFMPHIYRMRDVEQDEQHLNEPATEPSSPLETHIPSQSNRSSSIVGNSATGKKRVSNTALIPMYDSPNIDSLSKFPFKNSQTPDRVIETPIQSPTGVGASANTTQRFNENKVSIPSTSETDSGLKSSKIDRFETMMEAHPQPTMQAQKPSLNSVSHSTRSTSNNNNNASGYSTVKADDDGMKAPALPNLFASRVGTRHSRVSSGMLPPVAIRSTRSRTKLGKTPRKNSSISSMSGLLRDSSLLRYPMQSSNIRQKASETSLRDPSDTRSEASVYADAIAGPSRDSNPSQQVKYPFSSSTQALDTSEERSTPLHGSHAALPATLPTSLPRTTPKPPEITQSTAENSVDPRAQAKKYRREASDFAAHVKRSRQIHPHSMVSDDDQLNATAAAARAIADEADWPDNPNSTRLMNEKLRSYDDSGNPVCNSTAENFLLFVFVLFPPLWLLLGAGVFDGLFGRVSTRGKLIALVLSGAFFLMAIAGLVVGIVVGHPG